jgi:hypothetical protein
MLQPDVEPDGTLTYTYFQALSSPQEPNSRDFATYFLMGEVWLATHCHWPLGIFTQVSVQRS